MRIIILILCFSFFQLNLSAQEEEESNEIFRPKQEQNSGTPTSDPSDNRSTDSAQEKKRSKRASQKEQRNWDYFIMPNFGGGWQGDSFASLFQISLSPIVGITMNRIRVGAGPVFSYFRYREQGYTQRSRLLGAAALAQFNLITFGGNNNLFAHAEAQIGQEKISDSLNNSLILVRQQVPVGLGYSQDLGAVSAQILALYDLVNLTRDNSNTNLYQSGIIFRFGFAVGF